MIGRPKMTGNLSISISHFVTSGKELNNIKTAAVCICIDEILRMFKTVFFSIYVKM
jgi:hypothetical protein